MAKRVIILGNPHMQRSQEIVQKLRRLGMSAETSDAFLARQTPVPPSDITEQRPEHMAIDARLFEKKLQKQDILVFWSDCLDPEIDREIATAIVSAQAVTKTPVIVLISNPSHNLKFQGMPMTRWALQQDSCSTGILSGPERRSADIATNIAQVEIGELLTS